MGTLYLVATPIGNLEDISARALRILSEVGLIAAEDTRQTRKLLTHYGIQTKLTSYHEHNKLTKLDYLLAELKEDDIALVSEAGTPGLNDPGFEIVRAAIAAGHKISPIPGPSAPIAALVASGLPTDAFLYLGYLPRKKTERVRLLTEISDLTYTLIFLETPHRLLAALEDLESILGNRMLAVGRELTKIHEEFFYGTIREAKGKFSLQEPRGEFTLVIAGASEKNRTWSKTQLQAALLEMINQDYAPSQIAAQIASQSGWARREVYQMLTEMQKD